MNFEIEVTEVDKLTSHTKETASNGDKLNNSRGVFEESCVICDAQCYSKHFASSPNLNNALWALETREVLYKAFGIQVDPSFLHELQTELPLCKYCSYKVGSLKHIQKELTKMQTSYDIIKAELAQSVMNVVRVNFSRLSKSKQEEKDLHSMRSKSPSSFLDSFRSSEVDTLQQLIYERWRDRSSAETEEVRVPVVYSSSLSQLADPQALTSEREKSPEKFDFQIPVRNGTPKQYQNKKRAANQEKKLNVIGFNQKSETDNSDQSVVTKAEVISAKKHEFSVPHVIIPSTTIDLIPPNQQLMDEENEVETDRLKLDEPHTLTFHAIPVVERTRKSARIRERLTEFNNRILSKLFTLPNLKQPTLFRHGQDETMSAEHTARNSAQQMECGETNNDQNKKTVSSHCVEITATDLDLKVCSVEEFVKHPERKLDKEIAENGISRARDDEVVEKGSRTGNEACELSELHEGKDVRKPVAKKNPKIQKTFSDGNGGVIDLRQNEKGLYECKFCNKTFIHKYPYRDHVRTHTGEGPKCQICFRIFPKNHNLMLHMRTHTGEKPFKCEVCRKGFADKSNLKVHLRVHTGERPFKCEFCEETFVNSSRLVVHRRSHTGEKPFPCGICHRTFVTSNQLASHTKNHFNGKPFKCSGCGKGYSYASGLKSHTTQCHGV